MKQSYVTKMNVHPSVWVPECQEDFIEMVTEQSSKHNDSKTNLSLLTENSREGERIQ